MSRIAILELFDRYAAEILQRQSQTELDPVPEAFHQMRVYVKRARALIELVDAIAPKFRRRRSMRVFRAPFQAAGTVRDLHVQIEIAGTIAARLGADASTYVGMLAGRERNAVASWLTSGSRITPEALASVRTEIAGAIDRRGWVGLAAEAWLHFNARFRDVLAFDAHGSDLHDLRKRVKECSNLTWIIAEVIPELTIDPRLARALDKLQKQLGDWHDYDVAVRTSAEVPTELPDAAAPEGWSSFLEAVEAERARLRDKVLRGWAALARFAPPGAGARAKVAVARR
ncbi:MAG: CHAD domain-containing protein [Thermoanaerobaculia bacterium]|nr:CHAD domain-containing protein [Thermoanaerobaculia bacterium]